MEEKQRKSIISWC